MILGDYWDMISEEEKEELTQVFEQYITSNYLKCLEISKTQTSNILMKKIGKNYRL